MASRIPASLIGANAGTIRPGQSADLVQFDANWKLASVWQNGHRL